MTNGIAPTLGVPRFVEELRRHGYPVITTDRDCGISIVQANRGGISLDRKTRIEWITAVSRLTVLPIHTEVQGDSEAGSLYFLQ
jgi:hypothetical protein